MMDGWMDGWMDDGWIDGYFDPLLDMETEIKATDESKDLIRYNQMFAHTGDARKSTLNFMLHI